LAVPERSFERRHSRIRGGPEGDSTLPILHEDPFDPELPPEDPEDVRIQEPLDLFREGAVPVRHLLAEPLRVRPLLEFREPSVKMELLGRIRNITVRDVGGTREGDFRLRKVLPTCRSPPEAAHR